MKKSIVKWLRELLGNREDIRLPEFPQPTPEDVENLIGKITGQQPETNLILSNLKNLTEDERDTEESTDGSGMAGSAPGENGENPEPEKEMSDDREEGGDSGAESRAESGTGGCCPYFVKRNIVSSIAEVQLFAKEHELAAEVVKALLTALAEMTLEAMKGKVNASVLMLILNALNFSKAVADAYKEGELAGRNAKIEEKYFPKADDGLPHFNGLKEHRQSTGIFNLARNA